MFTALGVAVTLGGLIIAGTWKLSRGLADLKTDIGTVGSKVEAGTVRIDGLEKEITNLREDTRRDSARIDTTLTKEILRIDANVSKELSKVENRLDKLEAKLEK